MFCPNCGAQLTEKDLFCPNCGTKNQTISPSEQPFRPEPQAYEAATEPMQAETPLYAAPPLAQEPNQVKVKKSLKKPLILGVGGLLLALLIGFGIWYLVRTNQPDAKLYNAAQQTVGELDDYCHRLPNLGLVWDNLEAISERDALHAGFAVQEMTSLTTSDSEQPYYSQSIQFQGSVDYDAANKQCGGNVTLLPENGEQIGLRAYLDNNQLQLGSDWLLGQGEVVSLPLKDLGKQWNSSALSQMIGSTLPEDLSLEPFSDTDYEQALVNAFGDTWTRFEDSVEVTKYQGEPYFGADGDTYTVTWDSGLLQQMAPLATEKMDAIEDFDFEDLCNGELQNLMAYGIVITLAEIDENVDDIQAFVDAEGRLAGLYLHTADNTVTVRLDGTENLWQHITITLTDTGYGESEPMTESFEISTAISDGKMTITASYKSQDDTATGILEYNDADGVLRLDDVENEEEEEEALYEPAEITVAIRPNGNGVSLVVDSVMDMNDSWYDEESSISIHSSSHFELVLAPLSGSVQALSAQPRNLLTMTEQELEEFAQKVEENGEALGELFDN